jgi:hypothetical protein
MYCFEKCRFFVYIKFVYSLRTFSPKKYLKNVRNRIVNIEMNLQKNQRDFLI